MPLKSEVRGNEKGGAPGWECTALWNMVVWGLFGDLEGALRSSEDVDAAGQVGQCVSLGDFTAQKDAAGGVDVDGSLVGDAMLFGSDILNAGKHVVNVLEEDDGMLGSFSAGVYVSVVFRYRGSLGISEQDDIPRTAAADRSRYLSVNFMVLCCECLEYYVYTEVEHLGERVVRFPVLFGVDGVVFDFFPGQKVVAGHVDPYFLYLDFA